MLSFTLFTNDDLPIRLGEMTIVFNPSSKFAFRRFVSFKRSVKFSPSTIFPYIKALLIVGAKIQRNCGVHKHVVHKPVNLCLLLCILNGEHLICCNFGPKLYWFGIYIQEIFLYFGNWESYRVLQLPMRLRQLTVNVSIEVLKKEIPLLRNLLCSLIKKPTLSVKQRLAG